MEAPGTKESETVVVEKCVHHLLRDLFEFPVCGGWSEITRYPSFLNLRGEKKSFGIYLVQMHLFFFFLHVFIFCTKIFFLFRILFETDWFVVFFFYSLTEKSFYRILFSLNSFFSFVTHFNTKEKTD